MPLCPAFAASAGGLSAAASAAFPGAGRASRGARKPAPWRGAGSGSVKDFLQEILRPL